MFVSSFIRCVCGKIHALGGITHFDTCPNCGQDLWDLVQGKAYDSP
jgi:predicted  nucleic acid-binding Zn-ribbon protein